MDKYVAPVISLLCLVLRSGNQQHYKMPLPPHTQAAMQHLKTSLVSGDDVSAHVHEALTNLWIQKWSKTEDNPIPCPTERTLALLTLDKDGGHQEPHNVTGYIAKLEYCIRLTCLKELKKRSEEEYNGDDEHACDALQPWFTEKTNSPFSRIRSLQHRASSIAFQTMSPPHIVWTDRKHWKELLYKGNKIGLKELRSMFATQEESIIELWENKILCGIGMRACYTDLADDLSNHAVGYSFLTDERNNCFRNRDALAEAFSKNAKVMEWFGAMRDGRMVWNRAGLMNWLEDYAKFQEQLLLRCEMLSGAPGRGTELTPMTFCNTKHRLQRNLVIMGKHVTLLRLYHKSGAMTGRDKLIPHALDAVTGDLMIQSLALARPFAELAVHICYPDQSEVKWLYQTQLFVNKDRLFTTDNISLSMSRLSLPHILFKITVNPWRHISIAFKRKLGQFAEDLLELDESDTVDSLQAGHT